jgi:hypothetical protein
MYYVLIKICVDIYYLFVCLFVIYMYTHKISYIIHHMYYLTITVFKNMIQFTRKAMCERFEVVPSSNDIDL